MFDRINTICPSCESREGNLMVPNTESIDVDSAQEGALQFSATCYGCGHFRQGLLDLDLLSSLIQGMCRRHSLLGSEVVVSTGYDPRLWKSWDHTPGKFWPQVKDRGIAIRRVALWLWPDLFYFFNTLGGFSRSLYHSRCDRMMACPESIALWRSVMELPLSSVATPLCQTKLLENFLKSAAHL